MENYGKLDPATGVSSRLQDFLDRLDEVCSHAVDHAADLVIFAGDAFKTRDPDPTQLREFARRMRRLAERVPVFMLVGNHDLPNMAARATSIDIFSTLEVPNITVGRLPGSRVCATRRGPVFLGWVPFPARSRLLAREEHREASLEALDRALEAVVNQALADLAREAAEQPMPRVLIGHFTVAGAVFGSERSVMTGRDLAVQKSALAEPVWDYVALGHIHKHQDLTRGEREQGGALPPVVYSGSLERIDFGEAAEPKGFCWLELARGATRWQFVPVRARPFVIVEADARGAADPTALVLERLAARELRGAIVRVKIQLDEGQEAHLRRREVENALQAAEVGNLAGISVEVERAVRVPGVGGAAEALTSEQWLERYCAAKNKPAERAQKLLEAAREIWGSMLSD
jgi:exonuclease SbcD